MKIAPKTNMATRRRRFTRALGLCIDRIGGPVLNPQTEHANLLHHTGKRIDVRSASFRSTDRNKVRWVFTLKRGRKTSKRGVYKTASDWIVCLGFYDFALRKYEMFVIPGYIARTFTGISIDTKARKSPGWEYHCKDWETVRRRLRGEK